MHPKQPFEPFGKGKNTSSTGSTEPSDEEFLLKYLATKGGVSGDAPAAKRIVVIGKHKYYDLFNAQLMDCQLSDKGELRAPFIPVNPVDLIWNTRSPEELKFYAAIIKFQTYYEKSIADAEGLKALIHNPLKYEFYLHDSSVSEKITTRSLSPVQLSRPQVDFKVQISLGEKYYHVHSDLKLDDAYCPLTRVSLRFDHFLVLDSNWYLFENSNVIDAITYFIRHDNAIQLDLDALLQFQLEVLANLETHVQVHHGYLKPATKAQLKGGGFDQSPEKFIYLSDLGEYVLINPVMRYGDIDIPVLTKRQIYTQDIRGNLFGVTRDGRAEDEFIALLIQQHPDFWEQMENPLQYFYLHKTRFLDESWFLDAFEEWTAARITVLGFNELKGNKLNPHKAKVSIYIASGLNWFNALVDVRFGRKKASLKQLHKSVKNKSKFVQLDDGTLGILPEEWLSKLEAYFASGELTEEAIHIPKTNFTAVENLFEAHMVDQQVREEINQYKSKLSNFTSIALVPLPKDLKATLRPYQWQGLSWLNFLDSFGFGGCLADDMGLGKTVQIIAFMLHLREKYGRATHLLVVPTSLIHNWEEEISRFAPSLKVLVLHGLNRAKNTKAFDEYDVVITSYGTLISDVTFLKGYEFSYVFLDESQNIKNISSQRYKAARLLQSRNRIAISGTPIENNTFDIYAQLSFACPGLLGTRTYFKNTYAIPIDRFKEKRSAEALQDLIKPFVLRRTKKEVASELPDKTEVVLYCELGAEQRKVYDAYEREFRDYISATNEDEITKNGMHVLRGITKLRQICNSPLLLNDEKIHGDTSSKIERLLDQLRGISRAHKVLVFSQFVSMLDLIRKELNKEKIKHAYLTGSTRNRSEVIEQFQQDEETRVFLISLKAGGTGLNLTAADYVFLVDPWWNPAVENQAIDRIYRIGQEKNVIAVRLICPDTVEEKIMQMQQNKARLTMDLISTDESFFKSLTKEDLLGLMNG
ncbi:DEAD/DEAH box helicase [Telluribacter sp. SYSU D00476]|uniref:DEAD/DEAH box helicase n=1 Tax=Telluribacter sp. SYSU D00476 TaxID=2811430 RepID=UPI001FF45C12|nr:DEAD/DEAH box helicase [Telluribacter sp. SYSU D00476]